MRNLQLAALAAPLLLGTASAAPRQPVSHRKPAIVERNNHHDVCGPTTYTVITPKPGAKPTPVTKQFQPVHSCIPEYVVCDSKDVSKKKCETMYTTTSYRWLSTEIPCYNGVATVTRLDEPVTITAYPTHKIEIATCEHPGPCVYGSETTKVTKPTSIPYVNAGWNYHVCNYEDYYRWYSGDYSPDFCGKPSEPEKYGPKDHNGNYLPPHEYGPGPGHHEPGKYTPGEYKHGKPEKYPGEYNGAHYPGQNPSHNGDSYPGQKPSHNGGNYPGQKPSHDGGHYPGQNPSHNGENYPVQKPSHNGGHYPGQYPSHNGDTYPGQYPSHNGDKYPGQNPSHNGGHYPGQTPSHNGGSYPGQYPSHNSGSYPGQYPSHNGGHYPGQYPSHHGSKGGNHPSKSYHPSHNYPGQMEYNGKPGYYAPGDYKPGKGHYGPGPGEYHGKEEGNKGWWNKGWWSGWYGKDDHKKPGYQGKEDKYEMVPYGPKNPVYWPSLEVELYSCMNGVCNHCPISLVTKTYIKTYTHQVPYVVDKYFPHPTIFCVYDLGITLTIGYPTSLSTTIYGTTTICQTITETETTTVTTTKTTTTTATTTEASFPTTGPFHLTQCSAPMPELASGQEQTRDYVSCSNGFCVFRSGCENAQLFCINSDRQLVADGSSSVANTNKAEVDIGFGPFRVGSGEITTAFTFSDMQLVWTNNDEFPEDNRAAFCRNADNSLSVVYAGSAPEGCVIVELCRQDEDTDPTCNTSASSSAAPSTSAPASSKGPSSSAPTMEPTVTGPSSEGPSSTGPSIEPTVTSPSSSEGPSSAAPSSAAPSSEAPSSGSIEPTAVPSSSAEPSSAGPSSEGPSSAAPSSEVPSSAPPSSGSVEPTAVPSSSAEPSSAARSSEGPSSAAPSSAAPSSEAPSSAAPSSEAPYSAPPSSGSVEPTAAPSSSEPVPSSVSPSSAGPSSAAPSSEAPSSAAPSSEAPSSAPPSSGSIEPTAVPSSEAPSSAAPSSQAPSSAAPSSEAPTQGTSYFYPSSSEGPATEPYPSSSEPPFTEPPYPSITEGPTGEPTNGPEPTYPTSAEVPVIYAKLEGEFCDTLYGINEDGTCKTPGDIDLCAISSILNEEDLVKCRQSGGKVPTNLIGCVTDAGADLECILSCNKNFDTVLEAQQCLKKSGTNMDATLKCADMGLSGGSDVLYKACITLNGGSPCNGINLKDRVVKDVTHWIEECALAGLLDGKIEQCVATAKLGVDAGTGAGGVDGGAAFDQSKHRRRALLGGALDGGIGGGLGGSLDVEGAINGATSVAGDVTGGDVKGVLDHALGDKAAGKLGIQGCAEAIIADVLGPVDTDVTK